MTSHRTIRPKLLLLDGTSVVRRVWEAVPGEEGPQRVEGVLAASMHSIKRALAEHQPTHFLAAFDAGGTTWRHALFESYKMTRPPMFAGLRAALPQLYAQMEALGFAWVSPPGVEADDTLATVSVRAAARGFDVVVVTNDMELCVLLVHGVRVYSHFARAWRDAAWLEKRLGVRPHQVPGHMALVGLEKKSVPGVKGVGPKTASRLLVEHGTLEAVLAAAPQIPGKLGERLREAAPLCRRNLQLFTLKTDVVVGLRPSQLALPNRTFSRVA
ncbi:5'-3' exonuclease [Rubrivivax gelatinosus]|uniref:5'-3' exonuclease n=1 Tax=Rubrivivax gelatinosus TaxID=28068 RepID=UPI0005C2569A|nr:5'-3' exonuclease H3TH domain-containing protein [Rubrivivax gelatinosus]MBG6083110.1 DNA polymerase-1 [Rubrivivax gelatinosus]